MLVGIESIFWSAFTHFNHYHLTTKSPPPNKHNYTEKCNVLLCKQHKNAGPTKAIWENSGLVLEAPEVGLGTRMSIGPTLHLFVKI